MTTGSAPPLPDAPLPDAPLPDAPLPDAPLPDAPLASHRGKRRERCWRVIEAAGRESGTR